MTNAPRRLMLSTLGLEAAKDFVRDRLFPVLTRRRRFVAAYVTNYWRGEESRSGGGSSVAQTHTIRTALPSICRDLGVHSLLDVPCGDFNWMQHVDLTDTEYIGADIVPPLIALNIERYGNPRRSFIVLDLVTTVSPKVDLVFCRDLFVHLPFRDVARALHNIQRSGANWRRSKRTWSRKTMSVLMIRNAEVLHRGAFV